MEVQSMSLSNSFLDKDIVDCHVHAVHWSDRASILFPYMPIKEITCAKNHIVRLESVITGKHKYTCATCKKEVYFGDDPFINYNTELFEQIQDNELVFPFVPISPYSLEQIDYYEHKYRGLIYGYKLHPNYSNYDLVNFHPKQNRVYVVHSGLGDREQPLKIIEFAKRLDGAVIIAHLGRFCKHAYDLSKDMDNVFFDCSPLPLLWNSYITHSNRLYDSSFLGVFSSPSNMIERVADYIGWDKLVYGSDAPYGDDSFDMVCLKDIDASLKRGICYDNIVKILRKINYV